MGTRVTTVDRNYFNLRSFSWQREKSKTNPVTCDLISQQRKGVSSSNLLALNLITRRPQLVCLPCSPHQRLKKSDVSKFPPHNSISPAVPGSFKFECFFFFYFVYAFDNNRAFHACKISWTLTRLIWSYLLRMVPRDSVVSVLTVWTSFDT